MEKRKINAVSFTPQYDAAEDRIRLSINYEDIQNRVDFVISRAFILKLYPTLDGYMAKFYESDTALEQHHTPIREKIREEKVDKLEEKIDKNNETTLTDHVNLELYKQEDELLTDLNLTYIEENKQTFVKFSSLKTEAEVHLSGDGLKQVFTVLKSTIPFFSWGISQNI